MSNIFFNPQLHSSNCIVCFFILLFYSSLGNTVDNFKLHCLFIYSQKLLWHTYFVFFLIKSIIRKEINRIYGTVEEEMSPRCFIIGYFGQDERPEEADTTLSICRKQALSPILTLSLSDIFMTSFFCKEPIIHSVLLTRKSHIADYQQLASRLVQQSASQLLIARFMRFSLQKNVVDNSGFNAGLTCRGLKALHVRMPHSMELFTFISVVNLHHSVLYIPF